MQDNIESLLENYQPNAEVLQAIGSLKLLGTVGPSASGKTVVAQKMVSSSDNFHFVLGETSRAPRPGERNNVDYLFRGREEIISDLKNGLLVDVVIGPNGDLYCTRLSSYNVDGVNVMALIPPAILKYRELLLKMFKTAFMVPETYEKWQQWLAERAQKSNWTQEQIRGRLTEAKKSYEFALNDKDVNFVLNDQIYKAANRLMQVASGKTPDNEELARSTAKNNFDQLVKDLK